MRPHFAGHPGHLIGKGSKLIDHRVDRVLQLQDFAPDLNGDLLRQIPLCHRRGHLRNVAHLISQVIGHQVHVFGQVLPGAGHALDMRLHAKLAINANLPGNACHLGPELIELVDHRVDDLGMAQEVTRKRFIAVVDVNLVAQIALGNRAHDRDDPVRVAGQLVGNFVHPINASGPATAPTRLGDTGLEPTVADGFRHGGNFVGKDFVHLRQVVQGIGNFTLNARQAFGNAT